jgi:hypothetical protein
MVLAGGAFGVPGKELVSRVSLGGMAVLDRGGGEWLHYIKFARPVKRWFGSRLLSAVICCSSMRKLRVLVREIANTAEMDH